MDYSDLSLGRYQEILVFITEKLILNYRDCRCISWEIGGKFTYSSFFFSMSVPVFVCGPLLLPSCFSLFRTFLHPRMLLKSTPPLTVPSHYLRQVLISFILTIATTSVLLAFVIAAPPLTCARHPASVISASPTRITS